MGEEATERSSASRRLEIAEQRMRARGVEETGIHQFRRLYGLLESGDRGLLHADELEPVTDVPRLNDLPTATDDDALRRAVVIKLNGGLGTTMGLDGPKSLVEVRPGVTFMDVITRGVQELRDEHGIELPLLLMNSSRTRGAPPGAEEFEQHVEPRLRADDHAPVDWPEDPEQEWCPPGHGDLYAALYGSGTLASLRERGHRYAFVSNADNLGAVLDPAVLGWFTRQRLPFLLEVVRGTAADRKGGHIALRDGRLVIRETAQVPPGDDSFTDHERWRFYGINNVWLDLDRLAELLDAREGVLDLPLIINRKTLGGTLDVLQLETAMGSALQVIDGAQVLEVPRSRFRPVKTTDDLLVVRSGVYDQRDTPPYVELDPEYFGRLADFEARFPHGPPSLRGAERLVVHGDVTFGRDVTVTGDVTIDGPAYIEDGASLDG